MRAKDILETYVDTISADANKGAGLQGANSVMPGPKVQELDPVKRVKKLVKKNQSPVATGKKPAQ